MYLRENLRYSHFADNNLTEQIELKHQTDMLKEQVTYALYRNIAFKKLNYLKKEKTGFQVQFEPIKINKETINASFLKTHTGFTLQTQNTQKKIKYSISENGIIHNKKIKNTKK